MLRHLGEIPLTAKLAGISLAIAAAVQSVCASTPLWNLTPCAFLLRHHL
jgi:hypothetical protein